MTDSYSTTTDTTASSTARTSTHTAKAMPPAGNRLATSFPPPRKCSPSDGCRACAHAPFLQRHTVKILIMIPYCSPPVNRKKQEWQNHTLPTPRRPLHSIKIAYSTPPKTACFTSPKTGCSRRKPSYFRIINI